MEPEILNDIDLRNKERYKQWHDKWLEHTETRHGSWTEWEHGDKFDLPKHLREISAI
jgi:hypothetical protein